LTDQSQAYTSVETGHEHDLLQLGKTKAAMPKVLQIKAEPLTADVFHPFGQVIGMDTVRMRIVNDRFRMGTITMKYQSFRITHLNRHIKSTQALIPLGGKACLVVVAPPTVDLHSPEDLKQVKAFINDGTCGVNIDLGTWHMALLPLGAEMTMVNIQGEHSGADTDERSFEETLNMVIEVVL
jgi:ureidoglycolate hydrolase